ncbi:MAG: carboxypeptidase M32 [Treponema sp.]|jgi:carboxypeptidase Taq|nr:carboxypeptidase M32 [Treponema sp.]
MGKSEEALARLHVRDRESYHLEKAIAVLQWDEETYLPARGVEERSEQLALLEEIAHRRFTEPETGRLLADLGSTPDNPRGDERLADMERDFLRVMRRKYDRAVRLPPDFVAAEARAEGLSQPAWAQARRDNDFAAFLPHLKVMIDFARKKAELWGFGGGARYDGLLDIYEPGMSAVEIDAVFTPLRERLVSLLEKIRRSSPPDTAFLNQRFDVEKQARFNHRLMDYLGFDRDRGRLDASAHPFTTTLGPHDVRITTRYFPDNILSGIFSVIHESGHAFYETGFAPELRGSCLADGASMAFHESQSRFWENVIGRSRPFWEGFSPALQETFPRQLDGVGTESFCRAVNEVKPSLIRVDADEVSYALHIILRFELEKRLISGELEAEKLPAVWREYSREYLGVESETDADGVLQDVHWSMGSFGYFPSYALGNLYGAQIRRKIESDLPDFEGVVRRGEFGVLRDWLNNHIYRWGCRLEPAELLRKITGEQLSVIPFLEYIEKKYTELYGI